ncbi:MAG: Sec-independent protein translocase protein TatB [Gammaproteobacteria bacterium]|nr:Sec-independent protein translocase protein TatB [Gammaproteobacteria bacterium]MDH3371491.1 Sec-independent protein translocase protein TatB [Gammaproteobacteria bacterium]MDH3405507.1 Sec-independent protein translocase protein TatB [Gammaproteobacteria bacterium]MDH3563553.1 Sec-independent protein translocase protein TatB [Gammaproteobacteria bacterium]MDH5486742.1 Sec-independent protein translocase protein TatB [Gammaproteobacteria bacterium]
MFDIGFSELVAVSLIALIVLGPKRLPEVARTAGRWMGQLRRFITDVKQDIDREIHSEDLAELRKLKEELNDTRQMMQNTSGELVKGFTEINPELSSPTIHSSEVTALTDGTAAPSNAAHRRGGSRGKARAGKKHGKSRKTRRR